MNESTVVNSGVAVAEAAIAASTPPPSQPTTNVSMAFSDAGAVVGFFLLLLLFAFGFLLLQFFRFKVSSLDLVCSAVAGKFLI